MTEVFVLTLATGERREVHVRPHSYTPYHVVVETVGQHPSVEWPTYIGYLVVSSRVYHEGVRPMLTNIYTEVHDSCEPLLKP